jgi:hypothetical protein
MLPTVKKGANGILVFFFILPENKPITANASPRREASPAATNHPGKPTKTPIRAANFTSPIPSFPFVKKRIPIKIRDPDIISDSIIKTEFSKPKTRKPSNTITPGKTIQSGILFCLISITEAGTEKMIKAVRNKTLPFK